MCRLPGKLSVRDIIRCPNPWTDRKMSSEVFSLAGKEFRISSREAQSLLDNSAAEHREFGPVNRKSRPVDRESEPRSSINFADRTRCMLV